MLDRALNSAASIYRDIAVLQNNAEDAVGLINMENRTAIAELSARLSRQEVVDRLEPSPWPGSGCWATATRCWCSRRCSAR